MRMLPYLTDQQVKDFLDCKKEAVKKFWPGHTREHEFSESCKLVGCKEKIDMTLTSAKRAEIVRAAKEWIGTPYHHHARVKGAGADCAMFPLSVYQECGLLPLDFVPPEYSVQWHLHRSEELYLKTIGPFTREKKPCECPCHYGCVGDCDCKYGFGCYGIVPMPPLPADFVIFKFGRAFSHGAIVLDWPIVIHSYLPHGVLLSDAERDGELLGRERKFFEVNHG